MEDQKKPMVKMCPKTFTMIPMPDQLQPNRINFVRVQGPCIGHECAVWVGRCGLIACDDGPAIRVIGGSDA